VNLHTGSAAPTADGRPTTDDRRPTTDDRRPTTDDRRPTTADGRRTTADRRPPTDDGRPTADDRRTVLHLRVRPTTGIPVHPPRPVHVVVASPHLARRWGVPPRFLSNSCTPHPFKNKSYRLERNRRRRPRQRVTSWSTDEGERPCKGRAFSRDFSAPNQKPAKSSHVVALFCHG